MTVEKTHEDGIDIYSAKIDGENITWDTGLTYARHIQTGPLLSAQIPVSDKPDEMLFLIMHQTMELWLKLMLHEAGIAVEQIGADQINKAVKTLDRCSTVIRHMTNSWEVLATLTPHDFLTFRGFLRRASGFQSHQFRQLEFMLGVKREDMMLVHKDDPEAMAALQSAMDAPTFYDEVLHLLHRQGFTIPEEVLSRDVTKPHVSSPQIEDIWRSIYENPDDHWALYMLAEKITALEYYFQEWRFKHMKTVARVIGHRPGTGGSAGVEYLVKSLNLSFFPELWAMRTVMVADRQGGSYADPSEADQ